MITDSFIYGNFNQYKNNFYFSMEKKKCRLFIFINFILRINKLNSFCLLKKKKKNFKNSIKKNSGSIVYLFKKKIIRFFFFRCGFLIKRERVQRRIGLAAWLCVIQILFLHSSACQWPRRVFLRRNRLGSPPRRPRYRKWHFRNRCS